MCPTLATVYINDDSVYKIQWSQQVNKKWGASENTEPLEFPNGQVHWTMSYKDDYGDIWTTSAVTTYYQTRTDGGSLVIGPQSKTATLTSTPFFMDPDYRGGAATVINVDGTVGGGEAITTVYTDKNAGASGKVKFSFDPSFIGEQVNASIQALPNDVVRHAYVHTVFNYGADQDQVFIYPSMGVPKFKTDLAGTKTLAAGTVAGNIVFANGAGVCSPDSKFLTDNSISCSNINNFNEGKSLAVNDVKYRFPYWIADDADTAGTDPLAKAYTNCNKNALCIFITIPEPQGNKDLTVNYKFKTQIRTLNAASETFKPNDYTVSLAREVSNVNDATNALVTVQEVGSDRKWHKLIDGTPIIKFKSDQPLHDCSRRGLCDFETGKCKCFDGYSGYKCQERSVLGY